MRQEIHESILRRLAICRDEVSDVLNAVLFEQRPGVIAEPSLKIGQFARVRVVRAKFECAGSVHPSILALICGTECRAPGETTEHASPPGSRAVMMKFGRRIGVSPTDARRVARIS
jgi:hypothetical protein